MVSGVVTFIAVALILLAINYVVVGVSYVRGFNAGRSSEAQGWVDAINGVTVPNWQSIPTPEGYNPEQAKAAAQVYVAAYRVALDVMKEEIAMNRLESVMKELTELGNERE